MNVDNILKQIFIPAFIFIIASIIIGRYTNLYYYKTIEDIDLSSKVLYKSEDSYSIKVEDLSSNNIITLELNNRLDYWNINVSDIIKINKNTKRNGYGQLKYKYKLIHDKYNMKDFYLFKTEEINAIIKDRYVIFDPEISDNYYIIYVDNETKIASLEQINKNEYLNFKKNEKINVIKETYKNKDGKILYKYYLKK